jgi:hypothetical protein
MGVKARRVLLIGIDSSDEPSVREALAWGDASAVASNIQRALFSSLW